MKTGIQLIREFFGDVRKVDIVEMKALTPVDRKELSDAIALQMGFKPIVGSASPEYE